MWFCEKAVIPQLLKKEKKKMVLINFVKQCYRNTCNIYRSAFLILPFWFSNISFQMHLFSVFRSLFYNFCILQICIFISNLIIPILLNYVVSIFNCNNGALDHLMELHTKFTSLDLSGKIPMCRSNDKKIRISHLLLSGSQTSG